MNEFSKIFTYKVNLIDRFLIIIVSLIPLSLALSIFAADLLTSISGLILIWIFFKKKNLIFKEIKKEIIFFTLFFLIILIGLILSNHKNDSFLPSFFYFRYFLLSLSIFYLLKTYNFFFKIFYNSIFLTLTLIIFDSFLQYFLGYNVFGYEKLHYLSSFFESEKKLGSYLVRLLPLLLSIIYFNNYKISTKLELIILALIGIIIFLSTERVALFLLLTIYFFYFLISEKKLFFLSVSIILFTLLFTFQKNLTQKYIHFTMKQTGIISLLNPSPRPIERDKVRFFSYEHENLSYTGLAIFKQNFLFGAGVKSFYSYCQNNLYKDFQFKINERNNRYVCSTHPHNTYIQILSETRISGFILI